MTKRQALMIALDQLIDKATKDLNENKFYYSEKWLLADRIEENEKDLARYQQQKEMIDSAMDEILRFLKKRLEKMRSAYRKGAERR